MPLYEFECKNKKCGEIYSELVNFDETGKYKGVKCPSCKSSKKVKLVSAGNFAFSNPVGTDKWNNSHDYRYNTVLPKKKKEREEAAKSSHVGANPYKKIDDISSGENFGPVT